VVGPGPSPNPNPNNISNPNPDLHNVLDFRSHRMSPNKRLWKHEIPIQLRLSLKSHGELLCMRLLYSASSTEPITSRGCD
jgi:hypothetical protein